MTRNACGYILALFLVTAADAVAQDLVCRLPRIAGFDREYAAAREAIGSGETSQVRECKVYLELSQSGVYAHSNFRTPSYEHPTKLYSRDVRDIELISQNLIFDGSASSGAVDRYFAERGRIEYFLDDSMFSADGKIRATLPEEGRYFVRDRASGGWSRAIEITGSERSAFAKRVGRRLYQACARGSSTRAFLDELERVPFDRWRTSVINLVNDSATADQLRSARLGERLVQGYDMRADEVLARIARHPNETVIVLTHIEDGVCVIRDPRGLGGVEIPVADIQRAADNASVHVIVFGCRSAESARLGRTVPVNSLDAAQMIVRGMSAPTQREFFEAVMGDDLGAIIPLPSPPGPSARLLHLVREVFGRSSSLGWQHDGAQIVLASSSEFETALPTAITPVADVYVFLTGDRDQSATAQPQGNVGSGGVVGVLIVLLAAILAAAAIVIGSVFALKPTGAR